MKTVRCPHCRREVEWSEHWPQRPFCSEHCRLIDLGAWACEEYRIAANEKTASEETEEGDEQERLN
jgi:uncharacterized protein